MEIITRPVARERRVGHLLVNAGCAVLIAVALLFIVPALFGLQRYVITGGSMSGTFEVGSVAFEKVVPVGDLAVGDVITYAPPAESGIDTLVTHRIVAIDGDSFRTKGDANPDVDPWTFKLTEAMQPRLSFTVPWVGYLFIALADQAIRILLIGVPAAIIALLSLGELVRALRHPDQDTPAKTHSLDHHLPAGA